MGGNHKGRMGQRDGSADKVPFALVENLGSVPSTYMVGHNQH